MKNESLKRLIKEEIKNILENSEEKINTGQEKISGGDFNNAGQEKISGGDFNVEVTGFLKNLKIDKAGMDGKELKNLLDLFKKIVQKAREGTLNQTIEDRIIKALMLKTNPNLNQPEI